MKNDEFIEMIKILKDEGISYRSLAHNSNIPISSFYYYLKNNKFPYNARHQIEEYIFSNYKELIEL